MLSPVIETAIGLIFIFLLLSMVCSAAQEWIAALVSLRAKTLHQGLANMFKSDPKLVDAIYAHPLVAALSRKTRWDALLRRDVSRPSYIPAEVFSKTLLSIVGISSASSSVPSTSTA